MDPCLICGYPAVWYDTEGHVIKKEVASDDYSYQQLFSKLCQCLGMEKKSQILTQWDFTDDPFPFCDQCEQLVVTVVELYRELEEMEKTLKEKIVTAEEDYIKGNLYDNRDPRFSKFRRYFIPDTKMCENEGNREGKVLSKRVTRKQETNSIKLSSEKSTNDITAEVINAKFPVDIKTEKTESSLEYTSQQEIDDHEEPPQSSTELKQTKRKNIVSKTIGSSPVLKKSRGSRPDPHAKLGQNNAHRVTTIRSEHYEKKNFHGKLGRIGHSLTRNLLTGNITYETGLQHHPKLNMSTRVVLEFENLDKNRGYKCMTCSEIVPKIQRKIRQTSLFRKHVERIHSNLYKCKLCGENVRFQTKPLLTRHLSEVHEITSINSMRVLYSEKKSRIFQRMNTEGVETSNKCEICMKPFANLHDNEYVDHLLTHMSETERMEIWRQGSGTRWKNFTCKLCNDDRRFQTKSFILEHLKEVHNLSNMSAMCSANLIEEKKAKIIQRKQKESEVKESNEVTMCPTCGKLIRNLDIHMKTHLPNEERLKFLCSLCGSKYPFKTGLNKHMWRAHPGGVVEKIICKFPSCGVNFHSEDNLRTHVSSEHGARASGENKKLMCQFCGKICISSWGHKTHESVHTRGKSRHCSLCPRKFNDKETFQVHMAITHKQGDLFGEFKCTFEHCELIFPCDKVKKQHMRVKHGIYFPKNKSKSMLEASTSKT